jgi:Uma2 family endonuclease
MAIGTSPTTDQLISAEALMLRPEPADGSREELVAGRIVTTPPAQGDHGYVSNRLNHILGDFAEQRGLNWVLSDSGEVISRNPDTIRGPNLASYSSKRFANYPRAHSDQPPELVLEITSPYDRHSDVEKEIWEYLKAGVPIVWSIDPENRSITIDMGPDRSQHLEANDIIKGIEVLPGFECPVAALFEAGAA